MKRAVATRESGRDQGAPFEVGTPARLVAGNESTVGGTTHAALTSVVTAAFFTLLVQAALTFQKYRFDRGLMLGTTMAAVNWCEDVARRKNFPASRLTMILIATIAPVGTETLEIVAAMIGPS